jgi:hypothetical protein
VRCRRSGRAASQRAGSAEGGDGRGACVSASMSSGAKDGGAAKETTVVMAESESISGGAKTGGEFLFLHVGDMWWCCRCGGADRRMEGVNNGPCPRKKRPTAGGGAGKPVGCAATSSMQRCAAPACQISRCRNLHAVSFRAPVFYAQLWRMIRPNVLELGTSDVWRGCASQAHARARGLLPFADRVASHTRAVTCVVRRFQHQPVHQNRVNAPRTKWIELERLG